MNDRDLSQRPEFLIHAGLQIESMGQPMTKDDCACVHNDRGKAHEAMTFFGKEQLNPPSRQLNDPKKVYEENFQSNLSPHANKGESAGHDLAHKLNGKVKKGLRTGSDFNSPTHSDDEKAHHGIQCAMKKQTKADQKGLGGI